MTTLRTAPSRGTTTTRVARVPYLNSVPFFRGLPLAAERYEISDCVPRVLGERAAAGDIAAGPLPLVDYFRLEGTFERLRSVGIAVRGRCRSALLFARTPIRQLDGATIAVTEESSTTACLLRVLLEARYRISPAAYVRVGAQAARPPGPPGTSAGAGGGDKGRAGDAVLLIGDEALRFQRTNTQYPFEIDVAFEWWLWQHLPFVFAVWAIRKDAAPNDRKQIEAAVMRALAVNLGQVDAIAQEYAAPFQLPAEEVKAYLEAFVYRFGPAEEEAIRRFRTLVDEHHLL